MMPATTISGGSPKPPRSANIEIRAGGAPTEDPVIVDPPGTGKSTRSTGTRFGSASGPRQADAPLQSDEGAATTASCPEATTAAARAWRPGEWIPSSLVTSIRMGVDTTADGPDADDRPAGRPPMTRRSGRDRLGSSGQPSSPNPSSSK